jgi:hypothetical protein
LIYIVFRLSQNLSGFVLKSEKAKDFPKKRQKQGIKAGIWGAGNRMNP